MDPDLNIRRARIEKLPDWKFFSPCNPNYWLQNMEPLKQWTTHFTLDSTVVGMTPYEDMISMSDN